MESQLGRLAKFGLGKLVDLPNLDFESQWTCKIGIEKSCHESNMHHHIYHIAEHITSYTYHITCFISFVHIP